MLMPHGCIVTLIDGQTFEIYRNAGTEAEPKLEPLDPPVLEIAGHSGIGHHSSPGNHADQQMTEDGYARAAALWLNDQVLSHQLKDLVILAPPRTLGEMRRHYHDRLRAVLRTELAKDLVGFDRREIVRAVREGR